MKNQDKFGYQIYDSIFAKMLKYAKKLEEIKDGIRVVDRLKKIGNF